MGYCTEEDLCDGGKTMILGVQFYVFFFYGVAVLKWPNLPTIKTQPSLYICYRIAGPSLILAVVTPS